MAFRTPQSLRRDHSTRRGSPNRIRVSQQLRIKADPSSENPHVARLSSYGRLRYIRSGPMVARGRFELPSMGLFLVSGSKAHHWPGHCFRPLLVHYTTGLQETRDPGRVPISLLRNLKSQSVSADSE